MTVLGANEFTRQPDQRRYDADGGWVTIATWMGPNDADLTKAKEDEILLVEPTNLTTNRGTPTVITAEFPGISAGDIIEVPAAEELDAVGDPVTAIWTRSRVEIDRPLATHPAFQESGVSTPFIERIEKAIRDGTASETDWDALASMTHLNDYRNLRLKGVDSYRTWSAIITKTFKSFYTADIKFAETDAQKVVSYAAIGIPADVKWNQPSIRYWDGTTATTRLLDEWLVSPVDITYEKGWHTITKQWVGAVKWYTVLYEGGTAGTTVDGVFKW